MRGEVRRSWEEGDKTINRLYYVRKEKSVFNKILIPTYLKNLVIGVSKLFKDVLSVGINGASLV